MDYIAYVHKDRKSDYGVSFPDFPGCVSAGKTVDDALRKAVQALSMHIKGMVEDGETIPKPSRVDAILSDPDRKNALLVARVSPSADVTVRINISAKQSQVKKIERLAGRQGMSVSAYIVQKATRG